MKEDEWDELGPDIAALHHLKGLPEHMFHESLKILSNPRGSSIDQANSGGSANRGTSKHEARVRRSTNRLDHNPIRLFDGFQDCDLFTTCVIKTEQDFDAFLADIDQQKMEDWLLSASEISHSYSKKLLVITDKEKSTHDRVQQEYNMDPHYSVIVSQECLYNVSCVPEADSYSVVKIFGSVSEDGQTVSGLSGSSLAEMMLKPSLEAAPVFSLDGNATKDFQHNFIRVFMVRGIKAVLETNHNNHQIYQIMNQPDSVSSYQIPQRPVDHTTQYDHQQILIMENDPVARKAAAYLYMKHPAVSSVYALDENQRPKLIHGDSVPLSEDSRLQLVGHGTRDSSGETRLAGYTAQEVAKITQQTFRVGDKIKTTNVVACDVGSDKAFVETLMKELSNSAHIETELHLRETMLQVRHTGEKITQEITRDGLQWRHKDDSKKVVANLDKNGNVIIRNEAGSKGEAIFTNERNFLGKKTPKKWFLKYRDSWPDHPRRFINQDVFKNFDQNKVGQIKSSCDELEALSWGLFHAHQLPPEKINNMEQIVGEFLIAEKEHDKISWIVDEQKIKDVCYEVKSGEDILKIIRHYAKTGENKPTYLMINDWIYFVDPKSLYVFPVGKKLDNNQRENVDKMKEVKDCIKEQIGKEKYHDMQTRILDKNINNPKESYAKYVRDIFLGQHTTSGSLSTDAWYATYFTASVISESARNFRTLPLVLMALEMSQSTDNNIRQEGLNFFFEDHPMARGFSWLDPSSRGFSGSATPEGSSKLMNTNKRRNKGQLMGDLTELITRESNMFTQWKSIGNNDVSSRLADLAEQYNIVDNNDIEHLKEKIKQHEDHIASSEDGAASGALGGYDDGYVTLRDLNSASELENSFKPESLFSRASASFAEEIQSQLKAKYGEDLAGLHPLKESARIENGQFICQLASEGADTKPVEFRAELSPESQRYNEKMLKSIDPTGDDLEMHGSMSSHQVNKYVEHTASAVGKLSLLLGMKGAIRAFEQGHIKDGVMGTLQTAHGVTAITMSAVAKQTQSLEARIAKAEATVIKSRAMKGMMTVIPIVGIGFGIYNLVEDLKRGDTLGYIDAAIDYVMIELDIIELVGPELAPFIVPINVALSVVRMVIDDVYMDIQNELNSLPEDAGVLDKLVAVELGFLEGIGRFEIRVFSIIYDFNFEAIEEGEKRVDQISDYHKYYRVIKEKDGTSTIDFNSGFSTWNGGSIYFCLADQGQSEFCMDNFISNDESLGNKCWSIDTQGSNDIILGLGESHQLEYKTLDNIFLFFIPAGSVTVVSGYKAISNSRYGTYKGNRNSNRFFAVQEAKDQHVIEVMLNYYYQLYGEPGDDIFFLGPQRSYVEGSGGKDTFIIPENGGITIINNYDPSKAVDTLHFKVDYSHISVSKSGDDVVLMYEGSHTVIIQNWFLGETYRHMNLLSGDGVLFEISSTVVSSVQLVAKGINKMFMTHGETVDTSQPLLCTVTNILGSQYDDMLIGNGEKNLIDGGGGRDRLIGGEGEDIYIVKHLKQSSVLIENYSTDNTTDLAIIEANLHRFKVRVEGNNVVLNTLCNNRAVRVTLVNWFRSPADRHLLVVTKDLITFTISDNKADCQQNDPFTKCIRSHSIDYSKSTSALVVDLQQDEALHSVTEVRGSEFNDVIRGNKERNIFTPGRGNDVIQGRGGEDWYVITPGQGVKTINNQSPDLAMDVLFLKEQYQHITCTCEGQSIIILVHGRKDVILHNWFDSQSYQHLQIRTSDGITAGLMSKLSSCGESLMLPLTFDYRNQEPEPLHSPTQQKSTTAMNTVEVTVSYFCFRYRSTKLEERRFCICPTYLNGQFCQEGILILWARQLCLDGLKSFCGIRGKLMMMNSFDSVKEMYGSSGFDIMVGNSKENVLDPYTGGALMFGGAGKDTYIIKRGYGNDLVIDNFAEDHYTDTVLVDLDFLDGSQITLDSSTDDLRVMITTKGEQLTFSLLNYNNGYQHQHIDFQSSDGVHFKLKSLNSTGDGPLFQIEAFKVTLKQSQIDCRLDLISQRNLSKVHTVQGCLSQSNDILGNDQANSLIGGWKDDALDGGEGDDTLIGGNGADILIGGLGDDTLYGEDGNDTMMGNSGWDVFIPGPGADLVDGGPGRDTVVYRGDHKKGKGVYVNLLTGQGRYADAEGDVLKDVETVIGTIYSDILVSGYESSLLKGSYGNDILVSTGGDHLVGGDGNDIYMLAFHSGSVTIDNCAKDNATDVLYLGSEAPLAYDCQISPDKVILTFSGLNQNTVKIVLEGWISDENECGHLMLVYKKMVLSVDRLLQNCQLRQKLSVWLIGHRFINLFFSPLQPVHVTELWNIKS